MAQPGDHKPWNALHEFAHIDGNIVQIGFAEMGHRWHDRKRKTLLGGKFGPLHAASPHANPGQINRDRGAVVCAGTVDALTDDVVKKYLTV